jgi:hypothetical protein
LYWWRSVFVKKADFVYRDEKTGKEVRPGETGRWMRRVLVAAAVAALMVKREEVVKRLKEVNLKSLVEWLKLKG